MRLPHKLKEFSKFHISHFAPSFSNHGFTLIELLIVIAIIAILVSLGAVSFTRAQRQARDTERKSDLARVANVLEQYYSDNNVYPRDDGAGKIQCGDPLALKDWGAEFSCTWPPGPVTKTYMSELPEDPTSGHTYFYDSTTVGGALCTGSDCQRYVLSANLENIFDPALPPTGCTPEGARNYCIPNP